MADQVYENWWMNLTEPNCGIYYRGQWYATEADLNVEGYYIVYHRKLYLGSAWSMYKYHGEWYNIDSTYCTYNQAHTLGYSVNRSWNYYYVDTSDYTYHAGYYNPTDGYFVSGTWYQTLQDLNNAGYEVGTQHVLVYKAHQFIRYDAISRERDSIKYYFIPDSTINSWITEDQFDLYDLSFLPSVETNWNLGASFSNNVGHGGHGQYSSNFYECERGLNSQITISQMHNLFGKIATRGEWNCTGAYVGSYKSGLAGYKLWFEGYNGSSASGSINNVVASFYINDTSLSVYSTDYGRYSPIALTYDKSTTVVKVYNNVNYAYSAFKISFNDTIYYYVLDNYHDYWTPSLESIGYSLSQNNSIRVIYTHYGEDVDIPEGYHINRIDCNIAYTFPKYVASEGGQMILAYDGKDIYTNELHSMMLQSTSNNNYPYLCILQGTGWQSSSPHLTGVRFSSDGNGNNSNVTISEVSFNGNNSTVGDYFIYLIGTDYSSSANSGRPARLFMYPTYQSKASVDPYMFKAPPSIWSFENGVFSWLGDTTDTSDLAYYYYNDWKESTGGNVRFNIHVEPNTEVDRIKNVTVYSIVDGTTKTIEFWPHRGYLYTENYLTEQQLLNVGYSLTDTHENYNWSYNTAIKLSNAQLTPSYYDQSAGYLILDVGTFATDLALNNAGYVIRSSLAKEVFYDNSNLNIYVNVTSNTTTFDTSSTYSRLLYEDLNLTIPFLYDGNTQYIWDIIASSITHNALYKVTSLSDFPSEVTSNHSGRTDGFFILSNTGTPLDPLKPSDTGLQMRMFIASNYNSAMSSSSYQRCILTDLSYDGSSVFYYGSTSYTLNYIIVQSIRYYRLNNTGYLTSQELLSRGYTSTQSESIYFLKDGHYYTGLHNSINGYYVNNTWYRTEYELNNAGYTVTEFTPYTYNLNDSWVELDSSSYDQSVASEAGSNYHVVKSNSNHNVDGSSCIMYVTINANDTFTFKAMARSEINCDYVTVTLDGNTIFNGQGVSSFSSFNVSNAAGKTLTITYRKDGSVSNDPDRGYLALPII